MAVDDRDTKLLMRYVAGELDEPARQRLEERLEEEGQLRTALLDLQATWSALSPPGTEPGVPSQTSAILSQIRKQRERDRGAVGWNAAPIWIKAGSLASLALGLVMGLLLSPGLGSSPHLDASGVGDSLGQVSERVPDEDLFLAEEPTSADLYWRVLEASSGGLGNEQENGT